MKNVARSIGLFDLPREEDFVCVRSGVAPEMLKRNAKSVMQHCVVITHALSSTTPRQIVETFQAVQLDLPT